MGRFIFKGENENFGSYKKKPVNTPVRELEKFWVRLTQTQYV